MQATAKYHIVQIPCKPYIRKYCEVFFGAPIIVNNSSTIGIIVQSLLEKEVYSDRNMQRFKMPYDGCFLNNLYTDNLSFKINQYQFTAIGFDIKPSKAIFINQYLEEQFDSHLFHFCDSKEKTKMMIEQFCNKYKIEFDKDISYEAMKKKEYRYRKSIEGKMRVAV